MPPFACIVHRVLSPLLTGRQCGTCTEIADRSSRSIAATAPTPSGADVSSRSRCAGQLCPIRLHSESGFSHRTPLPVIPAKAIHGGEPSRCQARNVSSVRVQHAPWVYRDLARQESMGYRELHTCGNPENLTPANPERGSIHPCLVRPSLVRESLKNPYRDSGINGHSLISRSPKRFKQGAMEFFKGSLVPGPILTRLGHASGGQSA